MRGRVMPLNGESASDFFFQPRVGRNIGKAGGLG